MTALYIVLGVIGAWLCWSLHKPLLKLRRADGVLYLTRWSFVDYRWAPFNIYLHRIDAPDPDRHLHNHPWNAIVFVFSWRGYLQEVIRGGQQRHSEHVRFWNRLGAYYHRIYAIAPGTWTLCITTGYKRQWGFNVDGEHVYWKTYVDTYQKEVMSAVGVVSERLEP
jgi:hypothetical protein